MIYLILFFYLSFLAIVYDVMGCKSSRKIHSIMALLVMILVAGLRYRVGGDTIGYTDEFKEYPTLSKLTFETFSQFRYTPLWIILNSLCRSLGDFVFVQLIAATLHIGIWGYVAKQVCPSFLFSQLLIYYIFDFLMFNTEVIREGVAISFFLLAILALNRRQFIKMWLYVIIGSLFHPFALPIFLLFYVFYLLLRDKPILSVLLVVIIFLLSVTNKDFVSESILFLLGNRQSQNVWIESLIYYSMSSTLGTSSLNWKGALSVIGGPLLCGILMMYTKSIYKQLIQLDWRIVSSAIWLSILFGFCRYSMPIVSRFYNYFHFFTSIVLILFVIKICQKIVIKQRVLVYMSFVLVFIAFEMKVFYLQPSPLRPTIPPVPFYIQYYPYSSVFDKTVDKYRK